MLLRGLLIPATPVEAKYLVKIVYQEMRHGVSEGIMLDAVAKAAGGKTRLVRRPLRHTFATHHVAKGTSLRTVQEALGHTSLETTSIYVHLAQVEMRRELQEHVL
jgi:site-specific recombinase XerD